MKKINVLSLCDGMSCGHIAFDKAGIEVDNYFAAEIKQIGIKVTKANYPDTIHIGDVNKITYKEGILHTENGDFQVDIDAVIFGSPCQTFSCAMNNNMDLRIGLENKEKSGLFYECYRILKEINPTYFLMENVGSMKNEDRDLITSMMGVEPIRINSSLVSAQLRDRYYWTNIPNVEQPKDKGIEFNSILEDGFTDRKKSRALLVSESRPLATQSKRVHRYLTCGLLNIIFKSQEQFEEVKKSHKERFEGMPAKEVPIINDGIYEGIRILSQVEMERLQTVPEGYTKCLTRNEAADVLGDGWTVDVIAHIFSYMKKDLENERGTKQMEMKVSEYQLPEKISFNFEELKMELTSKVSMYETMVYTEENIKDAKADRANLNKLKNALNDERIRREKEYMVPFNAFKEQIKEIISIIDKPVAVIDKQVKEYEEKQKQEKLDAITAFFNTTEHPEWLHLSQIMDEKWMNASVSMKSVQDAMNERLDQIEIDLTTLHDLPEFGFEATEVYKTSLNINKAISEAQRMSQIAKAKAEAEAKKAAEQVAPTEPQPQPAQDGFMNPPVEEKPKQWIKFQALMTVDQAKALGQYMKASGIEYKAV